ncbi:hypothetical protein AAGS61_10590 [Lysinibacillus sp. KU-BSD001]
MNCHVKKNYLYENYLILELLEEFDKSLHDAYLKSVYESADISSAVDNV